MNANQIANACNTKEDNAILSDFYSKIEENTIKYLLVILKSSSTKPIRKHIIQIIY